MTSRDKSWASDGGESAAKGNAKSGAGKDGPAWADGLKQLYDDVVDEPLPDAFKDLLAQLDETDDGDPAATRGGAGS